MSQRAEFKVPAGVPIAIGIAVDFIWQKWNTATRNPIEVLGYE